jgi:UDP-glucose 4-epimerase
MKTLVTGGLGFVGSNLVDLLLKEGDDVYVIDNLSSESSSLEYKNPKAHYFIMDAFDILDSELKEKTFDRIFHLAAEARIQPSFDRPLDYLKSNIYATGQICEFARITNCKSLVYATTSSKNHGTPYLTPYTFTKVSGEGIIKMYSECFNMNTSMCTFYNVYGSREPKVGEWATVVAKFGRQYSNKEPLTVVGDGLQTRDFTHVEDICNGLISVSRGNWKGDNFDLGKGEPISILELARMWSDNIEFVPLRKNEGLHTKSDNRKTFEKTGWKAKHSLIDYINSIK